MIEQKKRPAAVTVGRKITTKVTIHDVFSVSQVAKICKRFVCLMGCLLAALAAFMFFLAPLEPGEVSVSAGWALASTAGWLCWMLYHIAEGSEKDG